MYFKLTNLGKLFLGNKCSFAWEVTSIGILYSANVGTRTHHDGRWQKRDEIDIFLFHNIIGLEGFLLFALVWVLALELRRERSKAPGRLQPGVEAESLPSRADDEYHRCAVRQPALIASSPVMWLPSLITKPSIRCSVQHGSVLVVHCGMKRIS